MLEGGLKGLAVTWILRCFDIVLNPFARKQQAVSLTDLLSFSQTELSGAGGGPPGFSGFDLRFNGFTFPTSSHTSSVALYNVPWHTCLT
jgi:hypothetical protein